MAVYWNLYYYLIYYYLLLIYAFITIYYNSNHSRIADLALSSAALTSNPRTYKQNLALLNYAHGYFSITCLTTTFSDLNQKRKTPEKSWGCTRKTGIPVFNRKMSSMIQVLALRLRFSRFRNFIMKRRNSLASKKNLLGEGNLIFCCTGPSDPNFWQIKTIILTLHITMCFTIYFSSNIFLFQVTKRLVKNKNLMHMRLLNQGVKRCRWFHTNLCRQ